MIKFLERINKRRKKVSYFKSICNQVKDLEGDIIECGVGYGETLLLLAKHSKKIIWGFDSFEGFPNPTPEDISKRNPQKGEWKISIENIEKKIRKYKNVRIIKGFFSNTLPDFHIEKISLLHLDCDLYQSYKDCLIYLFPKIVRGGRNV